MFKIILFFFCLFWELSYFTVSPSKRKEDLIRIQLALLSNKAWPLMKYCFETLKYNYIWLKSLFIYSFIDDVSVFIIIIYLIWYILGWRRIFNPKYTIEGLHPNYKVIILRSPSLSELTRITFNIELTYLGS